MAFFKKLGFFGAPVVLMLAGATATQGCGEEIAKQCGLACPDKGVADGNAAISGIQNVDAFFGAAIDINAQATILSEDIRAELDAIAVSVGVAKGATGAKIAAAVKAKLEANIDGSLTINYAAPKCEVSAQATVEATAKCDATVEPGSVKAECSGKCEATVEADGTFNCGADVEAQCEVNGPQLSCSGKCEGSCKLEAAAACSGTCKGECTGTCSVKNADGSCNGSCDGECKGNCELSAAASCSGSCEGKCIVEPANGKCEATATARCDASAKASAKVECEGKCEGEVTPPKASAECQASAKAEAEVKASCTPPQLELGYTLSASVAANASAKAEFEAWLTGTLSARVSALLALQAKAELLTKTAANFSTTGVAAAKTTFSDAVEAAGDADIKALIGYGCAVDQLEATTTLVTDAVASVSASANAYAEFVGKVDLINL